MRLALTAAVAAVGALAAVVLADAAPSGWHLADAGWRAALVGVAALAGSRARRWSLLWAAAVVVPAAGGWYPVVAGMAALAAAAMLVFRFRDRVLGAFVGASASLCALVLERPDRTWATAAIAAVALLPMFVSGYQRSRRRTRRTVRWIAAGLAVFSLVALGGAAAFGLQQRTAIDEAVDETREAVDALAQDDTETARAGFRRAADAFRRVYDASSAPWMLPARGAPVIGANLGMARAAAEVGADLNLTADELAAQLDQEALRAPEGGIDLAVLADMQQPVDVAVDRIGAAQRAVADADSSWLLRPLRSGIEELLDQLDRAQGSAELAEMAVERAPSLLGADGPRRYLLLMGNPAETRDVGGHIGNWAEVIVQDGRFTVADSGSPYELANPATDPPLEFHGDYPVSLVELRPQYHPQNWGGTPDFPSVARLAADLYPQARPGATLDGVLYADPAAFAALLNFTGPVAVQGTDLQLTPDNAVEFLTSGQFQAFDTELEGNIAVSGLIEDVMDRFGHSQLPGPKELADVLGPLVEQGRLQFASLHPGDEELLDRLGLLGRVERPDGGDLLGVMTRNTNPSKMDVYLRRQVLYRAEWNASSGAVEATVRVTLTNDAPSSGLPDVVANPIPGLDAGTNRTTVSVLSPFAVTAATLDGEPVGSGTQHELPGIDRHSVLVDLPAGSTRVLELELSGELTRGRPYRLRWVGQPSANPGEVEVQIDATGGFAGSQDRNFLLDGARDRVVTVGDDTT